MKIMHLISGGDVGGAKTHVLSLLQGLSRTEQVRLVCFLEGPFAREARELGIDTVVLESNHVLRVAGILAAEVNADGYQVVHCHGARANLIGALLQQQGPCSRGDNGAFRLPPGLSGTHLPPPDLRHHQYRLPAPHSLSYRRFQCHGGAPDFRGFNPQTMFSIYNGVKFAPVAPALGREAYFQSVGLQADPESVVFGIAARLSAVKDVGTLIRGFSKAVRQCPSIRLLIAGDGEQAAELKKLAAEICPPETVCFAGWVSDMDRLLPMPSTSIR